MEKKNHTCITSTPHITHLPFRNWSLPNTPNTSNLRPIQNTPSIIIRKKPSIYIKYKKIHTPKSGKLRIVFFDPIYINTSISTSFPNL